MIYQHKQNMLEIQGSTGYLYSGKQLMFLGDSYAALIMFIKSSNYDQHILDKFRKQLEQRQVCSLKKLDRKNE